MILAGNCALESMGFKTFGFGGGREDVWEPEEDIYWGSEDKWLGDSRYSGDRKLDNPLAAVQMGLIYVNPEGPNGNPDPVASGKDVRETLPAWPWTTKKLSRWSPAATRLAKPTAQAMRRLSARNLKVRLAEQGLGWKSSFRSGKGGDAITSGIEGA